MDTWRNIATDHRMHSEMREYQIREDNIYVKKTKTPDKNQCIPVY